MENITIITVIHKNEENGRLIYQFENSNMEVWSTILDFERVYINNKNFKHLYNIKYNLINLEDFEDFKETTKKAYIN